MKKLTLTHKGNKYEILPYKCSTWLRITKNKSFLALITNRCSAMQVIFRDINTYSEIGFLTEYDFKEDIIDNNLPHKIQEYKHD